MARDETSRRRRLRLAYELGRARHAALVALPALGFTAGAAMLGAARESFALGLVMFAAAAVFAQLGGHLARGVGPGFAIGLVPFGTANASQAFGHLCVDGVCMAWCMPACTAAGFVAGAFVCRVSLRRGGGLRQWLAASTLVTLAGAMGCHCIGAGSVLGLLSGLAFVSIPALPKLARA